MGYVFISYSHKDKDYTHKLHQHLFEHDINAWIDDRLDYGSRWPDEVEKRVRECGAFILLMSLNSKQSQWVQNELHLARQLNKTIYTFLLEGENWWHLQTIQYFDARNGEMPATKFIASLLKNVPEVKYEDKANVSIHIGGNVQGNIVVGNENKIQLVEKPVAETQIANSPITNMTEGALINYRYQLEDKLFSGGMTDIYLARDVLLEHRVVIKVLKKDYSTNETFQKQFLVEARAAANLSHPNIITIYDAGEADGLLYIVMEYISGKDLKQLIRERGRFTVEQGIPLIIQACAGVGYAHRSGLVHCDIKPHNMLISKDMRLKVTDFGNARAFENIKTGERHDVVWGSPLYFSPEQAAGESPTPASDVYSLGVVMYELFCGIPPFTASTVEELARLHILGRPVPISEYVPDIPSALEEIVMKVLSKEPATRYRTADQLGRVLQKINKSGF